jgi:hypothetical protein
MANDTDLAVDLPMPGTVGDPALATDDGSKKQSTQIEHSLLA